MPISIGRGLWAGLAGTLALSAVEAFVERATGRRPTYSPARMAARLAGRMGISLRPTQATWVGAAMRWTYGPLLGLASERVASRRKARRSWPRQAIEIQAALLLFELVALPAVGATPPLRLWPRGDRFLLGVHTGTFALAAAAVLRRDA